MVCKHAKCHARSVMRILHVVPRKRSGWCATRWAHQRWTEWISVWLSRLKAIGKVRLLFDDPWFKYKAQRTPVIWTTFDWGFLLFPWVQDNAQALLQIRLPSAVHLEERLTVSQSVP